ncbi:hypothetical protein [Nonomuraea sp. CA-141351]|uniref:hypothetical protein n=1 Tax=Nonomuraea sp. CA-141351 TaxID=3239996 RepID=UPI003D922278
MLAACGSSSSPSASGTPAAATASAPVTVVASTNVYGDIAQQIGGDKVQVIAITSMVGGTLLALGSSIPISPCVTTISFTIYLACRAIGAQRTRTGWRTRSTAAAPA